MHRVLSVGLSLTSALLCGVSVLAVTAGSAAAGCTLSLGSGATVDCSTDFDADLSYSSTDMDLTVINNGGNIVNVTTDLSGPDAITTNGNGFGELNVFEDGIDELNLRGGDDVVDINAGTVNGLIRGGDGNDTYTVDNAVTYGNLDSGLDFAFDGGPGNDVIVVGENGVTGELAGGSGNDRFDISGSVISIGTVRNAFAVAGDGGNDLINLAEGSYVDADVGGGDGNDTITSAGSIDGRIDGGDGNDTITVTGGVIETSSTAIDPISGGYGNDLITIGPDARVLGRVAGNSGSDTFEISGFIDSNGSDINNQAIGASFGNDTINIRSGAEILGRVSAYIGNDTVLVEEGASITNDTVNSAITLGPGNDTIIVGGTVTALPGANAIFGGEGEPGYLGGDDTITILPTAVLTGNIYAGSEDDVIVSSGVVDGLLRGGTGNDDVRVLGGSVNGAEGNDGEDIFTLGGGALNGPITGFETVLIDPTLGIDMISGDLDITGTGTSDITFSNIDAPDLSLDGISITGFSTGTVNNSVIGPLFGVLGIDTLTVNDSNLRFVGPSSLGPSGGGSLTVNNSTLDFINGTAGDTLTVGQFAFNSSTLGIDVDPVSVGFADEVIVTGGPGAFTASGDNVVLVNFTDPVDPAVVRQIPIIGVSGSGSGVLAENFAVTGVGANASPLVVLSLIDGPGGGLVLETNEAETVTPPPAAVNTTQAAFAGETINDINNDLVDVLSGFASSGGTGRVAITPQFGIFSSGSFGYTDHDGFDVSGGGQNLTTPAFDANSFSLIGVGEVDASAEFGLADNDIGLRLSAFGGYVQNDVTFSRNDGTGGTTPFRGKGDNTGGVVGGTVLASKLQGVGNLNYGLVSGAFFFGDTDVTNAATGGTGSYGTTGYVVSGKVGRNMAVADRLRLDLRVGASYQNFRGTSFTDTTGIAFGGSETSYGLFSFEPGVSTSVAVGDYIVSPSARAILQARVGYNNSAAIQGVDFDFDDGDLLLGGQLGAATRFNERLSGGVFVEGRLTEDSRALLGKLSLKYTIPKS